MQLLKDIKRSLGEMWQSLRSWCQPQRFAYFILTHRAELWVFLSFFLLYTFLGSQVMATGLLTPPQDPGISGSFLGYDNFDRLIGRGGIYDFAHPFTLPLQVLRGIVMLRIMGMEISLLLMLLLMALFVAASVTGVYAYARRLVGTGHLWALVLAAMLGLSFTSLTLSFTIETYPQSMFLLVASLYALTREKMKRGYFRGRTVWLFTFLAGGLTITNVFKPASAFLLEGSPRKKWQRLRPLIFVFTACFVAITLLYGLRDVFVKNESLFAFLTNVDSLSHFSMRANTNLFESFFAQPLIIGHLAHSDMAGEIVLRPEPYHAYLYYIPTIMAAILLVWGLVQAWRKHAAGRLLVSYFSVDFVLHGLLRYGAAEAIIYGGHWVFLLPLATAWLIKDAPQWQRIVVAVFAVVIITSMAITNVPTIISAFIRPL